MYKIFIVDDEPIVKVAFRSMLNWEEEGFEIIGTASDGKEALEKIARYQPDIIITDLKMPVMDGITLIGRLTEQNYPGKIIVVSNFGEYELIREALTKGAMDYMLKITMRKEELVKQLNRAISLLENRPRQQSLRQVTKTRKMLLKEFFENGDIDEATLLKNEEMLRNDALEKVYVVYLKIELDKQEIMVNMDRVQDMIIEIIGEELLREMIPIDKEEVVFMLDSVQVEATYGDIESLVTRILKVSKTYVTKEVILSYGRAVKGYEAIRISCNNAKEGMAIRFYKPMTIIDSSSINFKKKSLLHNYVYIANQFIEMTQGGHDNIRSFCERLVAEAKEELWYPPAVKDFCYNIIEYIYMSLAKEEVCYEYLADIKQSIANIKTCEELKEELVRLCTRSVEENKTVENNLRPEIQEAIRYINEQVGTKITLTMVANHINFNESYLSRIFKKATGKSINAFIIEVKMERAAQLMKDRGKYIKEIAQAVGIDNQFYFNKLFKKHFGITPKEYKNTCHT